MSQFSRAFFLVLLLLSAGTVPAGQVRSMNLEEMTQRAARILTGRCIENRVERDPTLGLDVAVVTFEVDRSIKGVETDSVTVRMVRPRAASSASGGGLHFVPAFGVDEEVLLFLYGESALGLTSPVGFGQGKFTLHTDKSGERTAMNAFGNANVLRGLSPGASARMGALARDDRRDGPLELDALLAMVDALRR